MSTVEPMSPRLKARRSLTAGKHQATVGTRFVRGEVQYRASCTCGWESTDSHDPSRANDAHMRHLRRVGLRVA